MEKECSFHDVFNSNFEPILHKCPYNLFDQDLFPGMTKNTCCSHIMVALFLLNIVSFHLWR